MAQQVLVRLIDDLNPDEEADETLQFTVDGVTYEIDLSTPNAEAFRTSLSVYMNVARRIGGRRKVHVRSTTGSDADSAPGPANGADRGGLSRTERDALRHWAGENGFHVSARGRIAADVIAAWQEAGAPQ
jgi:hypothetical protein